MSIHFHPLSIKEVRIETADCVSVLFDMPPNLEEAFTFKQGQSLTMRTLINGEEVRRTYSICSSPLDKEWRVAIKKVEGGVFSNFAHQQLRQGDKLEVMEPVGKFYTELHPNHKKNYLAFAAGSGITPIVSIIGTTLRTEPQSQFTLVYVNKARPSIIFFEELEGLKNQYVDRFNLMILLSRERTDAPINFGRIDRNKLVDLAKLINYHSFDEIFICGPEKMLFTIKDFLEEQGVNKKKVHFELFTTPGHRQSALRQAQGGNEQLAVGSGQSGAQSKITVKLDGRSFDFDMPMNSETTILDTALQMGADLPYACKGGVCTTCKARLIEGEVTMDVHWGLEHEEIDQGYILTCQSHPKTEKVIIDFDVK